VSRLWSPEDLAAARALQACGAPLGHAAQALDRITSEVDLALWQLLGRTPAKAAAVLAGEPETTDAQELSLLAQRVRAWLSFDSATARTLASELGVTIPDTLAALRSLAAAGLVDAHEGPPPQSDVLGFRWFVVGRPQ